MGHAEALQPPDRLTKPFWASLTLHLVVLGSFTAFAVISPHHIMMGSPTGGGRGVLVNPVASIPLQTHGPENPVANPTKNEVPTPPPPKVKPKAIPKVKAPEPDAVPLKSAKAPPKKPPREPQPEQNKFREQQTYKENQLYSDVGQRASSQMIQMPGGGGVGLGDNSPFGEEFAAYANLIRDTIARNWNPMKAPGVISVVVNFTIHKDGSVTGVKVSTSSGNSSLDFSAQRAILDAQLPALPQGFPRNQAEVQMKFELGN